METLLVPSEIKRKLLNLTHALHGWSTALKLISEIKRQKLVQINLAQTLSDLRIPPGNRLEALMDDRAGRHSIRINDQWRICFKWTAGGVEDVEIVDYH